MVWSFVYVAVRRLIAMVLWCFRSEDAKEGEILVLRHELEALRPPAPAAPAPSQRPRLVRRAEPGCCPAIAGRRSW